MISKTKTFWIFDNLDPYLLYSLSKNNGINTNGNKNPSMKKINIRIQPIIEPKRKPSQATSKAIEPTTTIDIIINLKYF